MLGWPEGKERSQRGCDIRGVNRQRRHSALLKGLSKDGCSRLGRLSRHLAGSVGAS
jgi:hypothetical protein